jgi:hypothetical protein
MRNLFLCPGPRVLLGHGGWLARSWLHGQKKRPRIKAVSVIFHCHVVVTG